MANIINLSLVRSTIGRRDLDYLQKNITIPIGIGNESDVVRVVSANSVKVHITDCALYESLSAEEDIINDTAHWEFVGDGTETFVLDPGAAYLKAINSSGTVASIFNITGV
jgi:hypothetical protein